jgi:glycosyltransferase involved in cell wall biosynthesis
MAVPTAADHRATAAAATALPRICFVAPLAWPVLSGDRSIKVVGGAEVQMSMLGRAFAAAGYRTSMICLDYGQPEGAQVDGITVLKAYRPDEGLPVVRFLHPRLTAMWKAMLRADADIYYFRTGSILAGYGAMFSRVHGKRSIYAGASDVDFVPGKEMIRYERDRRIFRYGLRNVSTIVAQNPNQRRVCRDNYGREATVIPSCYKPSGEGRADPAGPVLWVSTIRDYKRPEMFLEVARLLPHHRFTMIGGPGSDDAHSIGYYEGIEREARALPNVDFVGFLPLVEVEKHFDRASVFMNTSTNEGFPNTFLQAWSRAMPTIGTLDTGFRHEGSPVYHVARDARAAADEVERLLSDPAHWLSASQRCHAYFESHHSVDAVVSQYAGLFFRLMREGRAGT